MTVIISKRNVDYEAMGERQKYLTNSARALGEGTADKDMGDLGGDLFLTDGAVRRSLYRQGFLSLPILL